MEFAPARSPRKRLGSASGLHELTLTHHDLRHKANNCACRGLVFVCVEKQMTRILVVASGFASHKAEQPEDNRIDNESNPMSAGKSKGLRFK